MGTQSNEEFGIPVDVEARLRAQAEKQVSETIDEAALLAQYIAEARDKAHEDLRARAGELGRDEVQDLDSQGFPKDYVELTIFKGNNKSDLQYQPIGINGFVFKVMRGEKVIVPTVVVNALNEAVTEVVIQSEGGLVTRPVHRFPYQVIRTCTEEEYLAFRAKMKSAGAQAAVQL